MAKALLVLVADLDAAETIRALLGRAASLRIRDLREGLDYDIYKHPNRDNGCRTDAARFTRQFQKGYERLLVVFDREGSGRERSQTAEEIEASVVDDLSANGWDSRCVVVVIDPELESWVWSGSEHVAAVLGWSSGLHSLKEWLQNRGDDCWPSGLEKPKRPKEAMEAALLQTRRSVSAALFRKIASQVSLAACSDRAFLKLRDSLAGWFGEPSSLSSGVTRNP